MGVFVRLLGDTTVTLGELDSTQDPPVLHPDIQPTNPHRNNIMNTFIIESLSNKIISLRFSGCISEIKSYDSC